MLETLRRSFAMARTSYALVAEHPRLALLPLLSALAGAVVVASFLLPLWGTGAVERLSAPEGDPMQDPVVLAGLFAFYFCSYFVVVFFNAALVACTVDAVEGREVRLRAGLSAAADRLPQIAGWALLSAVVGVTLRVLERHRRLGRLVSAILGTGWTALTFFAVPILVMERCGPVETVRRSIALLRRSWGEALAGDLSVGWIGFLLALPAVLLALALAWSAPALGVGAWVAAGAVAALGILASAVASSAADVIFKVLLYRRAAGSELPRHLDVEAVAGRLPPPIG